MFATKQKANITHLWLISDKLLILMQNTNDPIRCCFDTQKDRN